jgi:hypothetical protein
LSLTYFKRKVERMTRVEIIQCEATESNWLNFLDMEIANMKNSFVKELLTRERSVLIQRLVILRQALHILKINQRNEREIEISGLDARPEEGAVTLLDWICE